MLASASTVRRALLAAAGIDPIVEPAALDETPIKEELRARGVAVETAAAELAVCKAGLVSARWPEAMVLGADQMLECAGAWFDKPADRAAAARQLAMLSGKPHRLISAAIVVENGRETWRNVAIATLYMRPLSAAFIDSYLDRAGDQVLHSVGAYQVEGLGIQLFDRIEGDHFTVLGLPLLPLLAFLRSRGALDA